jgi:flagellar biosynthesis protein FlhA
LARAICKQYVDEQDRLYVVTLDPALEDFINSHVERSEHGSANRIPPQTAQQLVQRIAARVTELTQTGRTAVILCSPQVRSTVRKLIESNLPQVAVLSFNEIVQGIGVEAVALVGMND